jgi:hypothetical protein
MELDVNLNAALVTMISLTMGVTQVYKMLLPSVNTDNIFVRALKKSVPLFALIFGAALSFMYDGGFSYQALESGLVVGLSAAGVYSGGKTILKKKETV